MKQITRGSNVTIRCGRKKSHTWTRSATVVEIDPWGFKAWIVWKDYYSGGYGAWVDVGQLSLAKPKRRKANQCYSATSVPWF